MRNQKLIFHDNENSFKCLKYSKNEPLAHKTMYQSCIILLFHKNPSYFGDFNYVIFVLLYQQLFLTE